MTKYPVGALNTVNFLESSCSSMCMNAFLRLKDANYKPPLTKSIISSIVGILYLNLSICIALFGSTRSRQQLGSLFGLSIASIGEIQVMSRKSIVEMTPVSSHFWICSLVSEQLNSFSSLDKLWLSILILDFSYLSAFEKIFHYKDHIYL